LDILHANGVRACQPGTTRTVSRTPRPRLHQAATPGDLCPNAGFSRQILTIPVPLPHECGVPGGLDAALDHAPCAHNKLLLYRTNAAFRSEPERRIYAAGGAPEEIGRAPGRASLETVRFQQDRLRAVQRRW
jgi:hypothetical protein